VAASARSILTYFYQVVPETLSKLSRRVYKCQFVGVNALSGADLGLKAGGIEPILSTFLISSTKPRR
jgi:hypothetical protein